ncbi:MAG: GGDEF domain-containing protein [Proteocatella sp.]
MKINEIIQKTQLISQRDTDGLTGLMNRNAAEKYINEFLCSNKAGVIMVFDIDNFKKVNDNFGHVEGDLLLIDISRKIKSFFREGDCVARLGGDEFLIFIPNEINIECIKNKAKSILQACYRNIGDGDNEVQISCSIGIVNIKDDYNYSFDKIYRLADEALYESKRNGKNRYTLWIDIKI